MSIVPDVIDALYNAALTNLDPLGITVVDGQRISSEADYQRLFIGVDVYQGRSISAEGAEVNENVIGTISRSEFSVTCVAEVWSGDVEAVSESRQSAFGIRDAVRTLIKPDVNYKILGLSTIDKAFLTTFQLFQPQTSAGIIIDCQFLVNFVTIPQMI